MPTAHFCPWLTCIMRTVLQLPNVPPVHIKICPLSLPAHRGSSCVPPWPSLAIFTHTHTSSLQERWVQVRNDRETASLTRHFYTHVHTKINSLLPWFPQLPCPCIKEVGCFNACLLAKEQDPAMGLIYISRPTLSNAWKLSYIGGYS